MLLAIVLALAATAAVRGQSAALPPMGVLQPAGGLSQAGVTAVPKPVTAAPLDAMPVIQIDARQQHPELDQQRISLAFADPTPIREILLMLVNDTQLSLIPDPSLTQTFVGDLKNVSIREALDLVLAPLGLDYSVQGNVVRVFQRQLETRLYSIDHVITQRTGSRGTGSAGATGGGTAGGTAPVAASGGLGGVGGASGVGGAAAIGGSNTQVSGSDAPDFYGGLEEGVRALLSAEGRLNLDRTAGLLQVTETPDRLDLIDQYIQTVMLRVQRQVQIEAKVIEVELRDEFSAGINWRAVISSLTNTVTAAQTLVPANGAFTLAFDGGDFSALLNAFATQGKVNVLQSPRVTAMNNQPAVIRIGTQDVFFTTTTQTGEQGEILQTTVTPQSITEGVVLSVTPQISADGIIHMSINPTITERAGVATSRLGDTVPIVNVRETDSLVRVRQGETIVIAGMMQDTTNTDTTKVPVLGDVPVVGNLFKRTETSRRKTDLVILLTPTIMGPGEVPAVTARELLRMDDAQRAAGARR